MSKLPPKMEENLEKMAKWAAHQPVEVAGQTAYMLGKAAEIGRDGTPEQKRQAREAVKTTVGVPGTALGDAIKVLCDRLDEISGHEGINL